MEKEIQKTTYNLNFYKNIIANSMWEKRKFITYPAKKHVHKYLARTHPTINPLTDSAGWDYHSNRRMKF